MKVRYSPARKEYGGNGGNWWILWVGTYASRSPTTHQPSYKSCVAKCLSLSKMISTSLRCNSSTVEIIFYVQFVSYSTTSLRSAQLFENDVTPRCNDGYCFQICVRRHRNVTHFTKRFHGSTREKYFLRGRCRYRKTFHSTVFMVSTFGVNPFTVATYVATIFTKKTV